jgi:hypothetical protein
MADFWNVEEIVLEGRWHGYPAAATDRLILKCRSLSLDPADIYSTEKGADGTTQQNLQPASLIASSIDATELQSIQWTPSHIVFTDINTGEKRQFEVGSITVSSLADEVHFSIRNEIAAGA